MEESKPPSTAAAGLSLFPLIFQGKATDWFPDRQAASEIRGFNSKLLTVSLLSNPLSLIQKSFTQHFFCWIRAVRSLTYMLHRQKEDWETGKCHHYICWHLSQIRNWHNLALEPNWGSTSKGEAEALHPSQSGPYSSWGSLQPNPTRYVPPASFPSTPLMETFCGT